MALCTAAFLGVDAFDAEERIETIFDVITFIGRYSKGSMTMREALTSPRWLVQGVTQALNRWVARENEPAKGSQATNDEE
jgi:hypothetical protein